MQEYLILGKNLKENITAESRWHKSQAWASRFNEHRRYSPSWTWWTRGNYRCVPINHSLLFRRSSRWNNASASLVSCRVEQASTLVSACDQLQTSTIYPARSAPRYWTRFSFTVRFVGTSRRSRRSAPLTHERRYPGWRRVESNSLPRLNAAFVIWKQ